MTTSPKYLDMLSRKYLAEWVFRIKHGIDTGMMVITVKDNQPEIKAGLHYWNKESEKYEFMHMVCRVAGALKSDAFLHVSDSWMLRVRDGKSVDDMLPGDMQPKDHPDRESAVFCQVFTKTESSMRRQFYKGDPPKFENKIETMPPEVYIDRTTGLARYMNDALEDEQLRTMVDRIGLKEVAEALGYDEQEARYHTVKGLAQYLVVRGYEVTAFGEEVEVSDALKQRLA